jgi:hypothetical protein
MHGPSIRPGNPLKCKIKGKTVNGGDDLDMNMHGQRVKRALEQITLSVREYKPFDVHLLFSQKLSRSRLK